MKNLFIILSLISTQTAFSQLNCHLKLSDSYSLKQIENFKSLETLIFPKIMVRGRDESSRDLSLNFRIVM